MKINKSILMIAVVALIATCCVAPVAQGMLVAYQDNFNSYANGSILAGQGGWTYGSGSNTVVDSTPTSGWASGFHPSVQGNFIHPDTNGATAAVSSAVNHPLSLNPTNVVTFDWFALTRSRGDDQSRIFLLNDNDNSKSIDFGFIHGGGSANNIRFTISNTGNNYFATGFAATWYELRMVVDLEDNTVSAFYRPDFNGTPNFTTLASNVPLPAGFTYSQVQAFTAMFPGLSNAGSGFDDLVVSIPEPATAGLMGLGGLVLLWKVHRPRR